MTFENAEGAVLGCLMLAPASADVIFEQLELDDFADPDLSDAFALCQNLYRQKGRFDPALCGSLPCIQLLLDCAKFVPAPSQWRQYMEQVRTDSTRRRAQALALQMCTRDMQLDEMLDLNARLCDVLQPSQGEDRQTDMCRAAANWIQTQNKPTNYIETGFAKFDNLMFWAPGDFVLIGGRPSAGKTAFSLQLALNMAKQGYRVGYFSYETHPAKLFDRLVANMGRLPLEKIKKHEIDTNSGDTAQILDLLSRLPIQLISASGKGVPWIKATAARNSFDVVMIDYLQLIPCAGGKSRYEEVTKISMELHNLAQQSGRLVVALCQLNRSSADIAPRLQDLRESGQLEQDADTVLLLHNPEDGDYLAIVAKSKESDLGRAHFVFEGATQRFFEN